MFAGGHSWTIVIDECTNGTTLAVQVAHTSAKHAANSATYAHHHVAANATAHGVAFETAVCARYVKASCSPNHPRSASTQSAQVMPPPTLPRLPVPALATTLKTFLRLVHPITSPNEYKEAEMVRVHVHM